MALREIASVFLRLGLTAFGGPAAHVAMMRSEVVERRKWLTDEEFLDLLGATNFIPGPNSTELAIHVGHRRGGARGLVVAGLCFIVPAALLTLGFAWAYVRYGAMPRATAILHGVKPVIVVIVAQALVGLGRTALKTRALAVLGAATIAANVAGVPELPLLFAGAVAGGLLGAKRGDAAAGAFVAVPSAMAASGAGVTISGLFTVFLKIGSVLFGSGYVLVAFLRADLVQRLHWLTEAQLIDAVAAGQVTPGPVFTTATFIGYLLAGPRGALVATAGIFLPAFVFVAASGPLVPKLRASPVAGAFLDGLNVASLALMAVVTAQLARAAIVDLPTALVGIGAAVLLLRFKLNATWLMLGGAALGIGLHLLHFNR